MPSDKYHISNSRLNSLTPVPTQDLATVTNNVVRIGKSVVRIEEAIKTIKDVQLPPVAKAATEARDGLIRMEGRVTAIENKPQREYSCIEDDRLTIHDTEIVRVQTQQRSTSRLLWAVLGIAVTICSAIFGFAMVIRSTATQNATRIEDARSNLTRHEQDIVRLEKAQQNDRATYLREVRKIPTKVQEVADNREPTLEEIEDAAEQIPLTQRERDVMRHLIRQARKRTLSSRTNQ